MRFGDGDPRQLTVQQPRDPPLPGLWAAVAGDERAVAESGGVAQIDVAVAAHELRQHLDEGGIACGVDVAAVGQVLPDRP
ncbi:hypothetical protein C8D88_12311 [Lentzea atacamensis]|uniref:Uncharacterized protein n=1 Tax=Lentzea atacamensis TaxID=531938 RepID=A0A316HK42_9PSEU|nr:hypothetical protein [Lentzea atacamensis]PWK80647.1 hypothetical protein C8D88_12311 [Lentzea atacamensis]